MDHVPPNSVIEPEIEIKYPEQECDPPKPDKKECCCKTYTVVLHFH